jgi:hypothetical protein
MNDATPSTSPQPRRLPDSWIQKIFSTMQGHYGSRWMNMWKIGQTLPDGSDAGIVNAMNHWAEKLGGYKDHPETIKRALESLPMEPPTLPQFMEHLRHSFVEPPVLRIEKQWTAEELERNKQRAAECMEKIRHMWRQPK